MIAWLIRPVSIGQTRGEWAIKAWRGVFYPASFGNS